MIVLSVTDCPKALRGDLSKWLCEINTGVYVGAPNARVRDALWDRVCSNVKEGKATLVYSTNNEQGYAFKVHNTDWVPIDYEGITLIQRPANNKSYRERRKALEKGFSDASRYKKARQIHQSLHASSGEEKTFSIIDLLCKD